MRTYKKRRVTLGQKACAKRATDTLTKLAEAKEAGLTHNEFLQYYGISKVEWHKIQNWLARHNIHYPKLKGTRRTKTEVLADLKKGVEKIDVGSAMLPVEQQSQKGSVRFTIEVRAE